MLGAPGSGKGTYGDKIRSEYGNVVIATGDMFRDEIKKNTKLGEMFKELEKKGELIQDDIIIEMLKKKLKLTKKDFILDGFPRSITQAEALEKLLKELDTQLDVVFFIKTDVDVIIDRLTGRLSCPNCHKVFQSKYKPSKVKGICDACGSGLKHRDDDKEEIIRNRFNVYHEKTEPLIDYYKEQNKLVVVDGNGTVEEGWKIISEFLK